MAETHQRAERVLGLFDLYYERVYGFLRKSTTPDVAEDLAQEVFLRLLQHPELDRLTISISYLLKIAHNLLRRRYARASRLRELLEERAHIDAIRAEPRLPVGAAAETSNAMCWRPRSGSSGRTSRTPCASSSAKERATSTPRRRLESR